MMSRFTVSSTPTPLSRYQLILSPTTRTALTSVYSVAKQRSVAPDPTFFLILTLTLTIILNFNPYHKHNSISSPICIT